MEDNYKKEIKEVSIDLVKPYWKNVKLGTNIEEVKESIKRFGYNSYIEVDEKMTIINGHSRYKALKQLGYDKIKVNIILGMSEKEAKAYRIVDNKVAESNEWDDKNLKIELRELGTIDDMQIYFDDIQLESFLDDDIGVTHENITNEQVNSQNEKNQNKFIENEDSLKSKKNANVVICPSCYEEFELTQ